MKVLIAIKNQGKIEGAKKALKHYFICSLLQVNGFKRINFQKH